MLFRSIISDNWKKLSEFYQKAFGGIPTGSVRDYKNEWIANLVGIPGVHVKGQHVAVPGFKDNGPTLEIFTYNKKATQGPLGIDDLGIISTGYKTKNLGAAFKAVKEAGGSIVTIKGKTFARDIDGNLIQLSAR